MISLNLTGLCSQLAADRLGISTGGMDKVRHVSEQATHDLSSRTIFSKIGALRPGDPSRFEDKHIRSRISWDFLNLMQIM